MQHNYYADPCSSSTTSCGTNAICSVENHQAVCSCPAGLTGDPARGCRHPVQVCSSSVQCRKGYKCVGGVCAASCSSSNENCLLNEVCVKGTCRPLCNSNADCSEGYICKERFCVAGCSADSQCKENQACINSQCQGENHNVLRIVINYDTICRPLPQLDLRPVRGVFCHKSPGLLLLSRHQHWQPLPRLPPPHLHLQEGC